METLNIQDIKRRVSLVAHNFFKARDFLQNYADLSEKNTKTFIAYIRAVERAYELLEDKEKVLLNNEYFYNGKKDWWKSSFTSAEFETLHNSTVIHFIEGFYATIN